MFWSDAVIGFGPRQAIALEAAGFRIPDDFAFAALDVQQARLEARPEVSGIDQNLPLIGATAIDILAGRLYHNERACRSGRCSAWSRDSGRRGKPRRGR